ncbi:MAG: divalent metal cation transporter [Planctomycetota bacterium]
MSAPRAERERQAIVAARTRGRGAVLRTYARLSGPGWLQSAITLGGGSLAGSLYLGVLGCYELLWLQPLAMAAGVVMLSAISYVTLSSGARPFDLMRRHLSPVVAWAWALATLVASMVWSLPQFALGAAAIQQNLMPSAAVAGPGSTAAIVAALLAGGLGAVWLWDGRGRGRVIFEVLLKAMVGLVVLSFIAVAVLVAWRGGLPWGDLFAGLVPRPALLFEPTTAIGQAIDAVPVAAQEFWRAAVIADQRDVMVSAAATAVGINMTFLLPYSMLARGWTREHRGLAIFDLALGLFVPFALATSCVVIAATAQFHADPDPRLLAGDPAPAAMQADFDRRLAERTAADAAPIDAAERRLAAMLVRRDAADLAAALSPLGAGGGGRVVFGIGVLGMAWSTIILLMLISGMAFAEMLGRGDAPAARRIGSVLAAVGVLGPFVWHGKTQFWLAVPTSVFGFTLLPIAYTAFVLLLNHRGLLGADRPRGATALLWNAALWLALAVTTLGAAWVVWAKAGWWGVSAFGLLVAAAWATRPRGGAAALAASPAAARRSGDTS